MSSLVFRLTQLDPPRRPAPVVDLHALAGGLTTVLGRWSAATAAAQDGCLVLDPQGRVVSLSARAAELLDCSADGVIGRQLVDITHLIDFESGEPDPDYSRRVPPLSALSDGGMSRTLVRIRHRDDAVLTLDVCGMPLHDANGTLVGSISWLAPLHRR